MDAEIKKRLATLGGDDLINTYESVKSSQQVMRLPSSETDSLSIGYAVIIGTFAAIVDVIMDSMFREEMEKKHRERTPEEQAVLEAEAKKAMEEAGVEPGGEDGDPDSAMDWYRTLNEEMELRQGHKLRPKNHRILNHMNEEAVIQMLMKGEVGFGKFKIKLYPEMSYEAAKKVYDAHIRADRGTKQSLPLEIMSWLWEQGVKAGNPEKFGEANPLYKLLNAYMPNIDWAKLLNKVFHKEGVKNPIPEGSSLGEAMLKLYETGTLNERVFWTSDFGAAFGGAKRRIFITALLEVGVEIYAFAEGISLGFINLKDGIGSLVTKANEWRAQPKYMDMRIAAQCVFCAGSSFKALVKGDPWNLNYFAFAAAMRHLWVYPRVQREHYDRLINLSQTYRSSNLAEFTARTGIRIRPTLTVIEGGKLMPKLLDDRLHNAGCQSTRVRVLASRYPDKLEPLINIYEELALRAEEDEDFMPKFDALCEAWYLGKVEDDYEAIKKLEKDLKAIR